jgi:outer membrane lipoprotein-sorting protein
MKPLFRAVAVGALLTLSQLVANAFEGKITLAVTDPRGSTMNMDYSMKGAKIRMDMKAHDNEAAMIMDVPKQEMIMLMTDQRMYMVMPMKKAMDKAMEQAGANTADVEMTGKTETILGYKCSQILVKDKGNVTEVWVADGLGNFMGMNNGGGPFGGGRGPQSAKWEAVLKGKGGFPLRVTTRDAAGKQVSKMEATKIEPGSLPDSLFAPPADFQKFDMPNMGDMFKGGE